MSLAPYVQITISDVRRAPSAATRADLPVIAAETDSGEGALARHAKLVATLTSILRGAAEAIYRDRDIARAYIDHSLALLQANQDWGKIGCEHFKAVRGGLAPWQIVRV